MEPSKVIRMDSADEIQYMIDGQSHIGVRRVISGRASPPSGRHKPLSTEPTRRATEPATSTLLRAPRIELVHSRPRNCSPYSRTHLRSYSAAGALQAPPMARTRSLPNTSAPLAYSPSHSPVRPSSPLRSPVVKRPSPKRSFEDFRPPAPTPSFMDIESIAEDSELDIAPRAPLQDGSLSTSTIPLQHASTIPRSNPSSRRSSASLHSHQLSVASPPSSHQSPSPPPSRYNEVYPGAAVHLHLSAISTNFSASSMPSTPTSVRSRSPSISSLETIPDSPDAEEAAATEAFDVAQLRAAVEAAESGSDSDSERKPRSSSGPGSRTSDKNRKRWSVCGAERRGDFEMETIWED